MAFKKKNARKLSVLTFLFFLWMTEAKLSQDNKTHLPETKSSPKMAVTVKGKNTTTVACDLDADQQDLAGRLATLALRAHSAARSDCSRLGAALANTLGELARTAANRHAMSAAAVNEANKKRKLSKSQKAKIQAKQRTALAVKKKAAAAAAAAAAKMAS